MKIRPTKMWLGVAFIVMGTMLAGSREACASGITIKIGQQPGGGDPPYDYIIQVYLDPGYGIDYGNSFTVENLTGVTPGSFTQEPINIPGGVSWSPQLTETNSTSPYASDVQWYFTGTTPYNNTGSGEIYLGQFGVETTVSFTSPPYSNGTPIFYDWSIVDNNGNPSSGSGQTPIVTLGVPEPTSALLLTCGVAILPLLVLHQRRRSRTRQE
jgi:hypothetical protein